jgi:hypothetical protein
VLGWDGVPLQTKLTTLVFSLVSMVPEQTKMTTLVFPVIPLWNDIKSMGCLPDVIEIVKLTRKWNYISSPSCTLGILYCQLLNNFSKIKCKIPAPFPPYEA